MTTTEYIRGKGLDCKIQSGQLILKTCPYCNDQGHHFYIDHQKDTSPFYCHKCNEGGNLITLKKHLGDNGNGKTYNAHSKPQGGISEAFPSKGKPCPTLDEKIVIKAHEALLQENTILEYVTVERGISLDTVKRYRLGLEVDRSGGKWLTIPHYADGKLVNVKSRSLPPAEKTFKRVPDCKSILFNQDVIAKADEVYICEGEIDCLTLIDRGIGNAVSGTTGAGSFDPAWIDQLEKVKRIYIVYDSDTAGQKGARELARRLGYDRCYNVELPDGQDVNDFFKLYDLAEFKRVAKLARKFDVVGVMSIEQGIEFLRTAIDRPEQTAGIRTGWQSVDRILKTGLCPGELTVLSAPPKIGKSSFALQMCVFNSLQGIPSLFFCLEMRPMKVIEKIVRLQTATENIGQDELDKAEMNFCSKPLYLGYCYQKPALDGIIDTIKQAIKRYGLRLVVFDHLHFLCRSITNQVQEVGLAVQAFKFLAEEMEIPIVLIAQPRKINVDAVMTAQDLKDSSSIYSDCDHLILMHRKRKIGNGVDEPTQDTAFDPVTLIRVEASRYNAGGEILLYFHGEYSRFDELSRR